jgi:uncharacterized delta-60 repeat protein
MKSKITLFISLLIFVVLSIRSFPQNGQLDTTFGQGGIVTTALNVIGSGQINSLVLEPDGKIVAAGIYDNDAGTNDVKSFAFARYNPDGSMDRNFGDFGRLFVSAAPTYSGANSVKIDSFRQIMAGGSAIINGHYQFSFVRLQPTGQEEIFYSTHENIPVGTYDAEINSTAIQSDGKVVMAGYAEDGTAGEEKVFSIARFFNNNEPDSSFGPNHNGTVTLAIGTRSDVATSVALQSVTNGEEMIVVAGYSYNGHNYDFALVRYNSNGSVDSSFGSNRNGIVTTPVGDGHDEANSVAIQKDGKIILGGYSDIASHEVFAMVRYKQDGTIDSSFGINSNGIVATPIGISANIKSVQISNNGKIIAAGYSNDGNSTKFAVACYNPDGSLDNNFRTNGIVTTLVGEAMSVANAAVVQPDGKIILGGYYSNGDETDYDFAMVRYNPDGSLDKNFGQNGKVMTEVGIPDDNAYATAIQSDGKILVGGACNIENSFNFALVRYKTDGSLDSSFGENANGVVITHVGNSNSHISSIAIQSDGKIVGAGAYSRGNNYNFALVRYNTNGTLDQTFGNDGIDTVQVGNLSEARSVIIQSDGKILAGGYCFSGNLKIFTLVLYSPNGNLDNTFGKNGIDTIRIGSIGLTASSLTQTDGKILAAGSFNNLGTTPPFVIVRCYSDGNPDSTFGTNGLDTISIGTGHYSTANSLALQNDGKIVAAGYCYTGTHQEITVVRFNPDGSLDKTFGSSGIDTVENQAEPFTIAIQKDNKILVGSYYYSFVLARFNQNGGLDNTFGTNGIATTHITTNSNDYLRSIALQSDGKVVAAGYSESSDNSGTAVFSLVRYSGSYVTDINKQKISAVPSSFKLEQNYPNPFNPTTVISWQLPVSSRVVLKVYDVLGREVSTLVNKEEPAGTHKVVFNASTLSSGVYFYSLTVGGFHEVKKLVLLK